MGEREGRDRANDVLLANRAADGDVVAFDALVRRHQLAVMRLCVNLLGDHHAAQDVAQDTFFTAWRSIGRFRGEAKFSTWLYRIATNRCLKELKKRRPSAPALPDLPASEGGPHEQLEATERLGAVNEAIGRLSGEQRAAFLLREVEGLSYGDIAEVLQMSLPAVKSRIYRARVELARQLSGQ